MKRVVTGLCLAAGTAALVLVGPTWAFAAFVVGLSVLALREFYGLAGRSGLRPMTAAGQAAAVVWLLAPNLDRGYLATLLAIALLGAAALSHGPLERVLPSAAVTLAGVLYVAGPMLAGILLHARSPRWAFFALLVVAIGDVAAYAVGRAFGRTKLAPVTSPNKTWEGTVASVVASTGAGVWFASTYLATQIGTPEAAGLCIVVNVFAQVGDLTESALKRAAGTKDSGAILPGHGGVLDRIDGILFGVPIAYGYVLLFG